MTVEAPKWHMAHTTITTSLHRLPTAHHSSERCTGLTPRVKYVTADELLSSSTWALASRSSPRRSKRACSTWRTTSTRSPAPQPGASFPLPASVILCSGRRA